MIELECSSVRSAMAPCAFHPGPSLCYPRRQQARQAPPVPQPLGQQWGPGTNSETPHAWDRAPLKPSASPLAASSLANGRAGAAESENCPARWLGKRGLEQPLGNNACGKPTGSGTPLRNRIPHLQAAAPSPGEATAGSQEAAQRAPGHPAASDALQVPTQLP